ncbi:hypothetical protein TRIATDRAFT_299304 [Trichoderma atroviride IMI 206040]|uniref:Uncharacterized protein n=1 Tax=Hypocrea atroviridis (strain ATCC 20476 / IMI 206040) TaxID=452589 RepID=G9NU54_HYPAI|nr:uncharacterized protein TRIATDRAFT_299304 [Trichoderma atroviride IMI 206040]EHK45587.1 hypothetical protein TRIATDRAFT_299304 [Trichoderma atroviride IMI 206040]
MIGSFATLASKHSSMSNTIPNKLPECHQLLQQKKSKGDLCDFINATKRTTTRRAKGVEMLHLPSRYNVLLSGNIESCIKISLSVYYSIHALQPGLLFPLRRPISVTPWQQKHTVPFFRRPGMPQALNTRLVFRLSLIC